jgi:ribosomal protein S27AE
MKLLLAILICLPLTAFAQGIHSGKGKVVVPSSSENEEKHKVCPECKKMMIRKYSIYTFSTKPAKYGWRWLCGWCGYIEGDETEQDELDEEETAEDSQTKEDILETYGKPFWKSEGGQKEVWYYPHKKMFIYFEDDKVVEIDIMAGETGHI